MKPINSRHFYEFSDITQAIEDCFGHKMVSIDEYIDEMNMLMERIRILESQIKEWEFPFLVRNGNLTPIMEVDATPFKGLETS